MSFILWCIVDGIDDVGSEDFVVAVYHVDEIVFIRVLKRDEVCIHKVADETLVLNVRVLFLVVFSLLKRRVRIYAKVG